MSALKPHYADLHIHMGTAGGEYVKISASRELTLDTIIEACAGRKGIEIIGLIDAVCTPVLEELQSATVEGRLRPLPEGGLVAADGRVLLIPGAELEVMTAGKAVHYLCYFPNLERLHAFHQSIAPHVTNLRLSSQRVHLDPNELLRRTLQYDGFLVVAHAFTPHKGFFGHAATALADVFTSTLLPQIAAIELGLSADTEMADQLDELHSYPYLTNSDAHSLRTIAREYNVFELAEPTFTEVRLALQHRAGRRIALNCGLDPRLGKYHVTHCRTCGQRVPLQPDRRCEVCGGRVVVGVADRLYEIAEAVSTHSSSNPKPRNTGSDNRRLPRPPYRHQTPLDFIPGIGPATLRRLLDRFGTEMHILHAATLDELRSAVGPVLGERIHAARHGELGVSEGGGGRYGRVAPGTDSPRTEG